MYACWNSNDTDVKNGPDVGSAVAQLLTPSPGRMSPPSVRQKSLALSQNFPLTVGSWITIVTAPDGVAVPMWLSLLTYAVFFAQLAPPSSETKSPILLATSTRWVAPDVVRSTAMEPMAWPAKVAWPSSAQVAPPSILLRMPWPNWESERLSSPVPA